MSADPIPIALRMARVLEGLGIPYVIGGSVASSLYGEPRTTLDVDFAVQLEAAQADELVARLGDEFHVSEEGVARAIAIHRDSMVKVDVYVRPPEGLFASEIERGRRVVLRAGEGGAARVATAEDTLLQKLRWHALGGGASTQQWRDVLGIVKAMGSDLDRAYLDGWAARLGLTDRLARAFHEASP